MKTIAAVRSRETVLSRFLWITFFALLTGIASWVRIPIPFTPVPVTLQTAVVLLCGISLGRDGVHAQILYLLLGSAGLPIFAGGLLGPTGGYLLGFVVAAWMIGGWIHPRWNRWNYLARAASLCGISLLILSIGTVHLSVVFGFSASHALFLGFVPFVLGEIAKSLIVAGFPRRDS